MEENGGGSSQRAAEGSRSEWQNALDPQERAAFGEDVAMLRREVPEAVFETAWRIGAARSEQHE